MEKLTRLDTESTSIMGQHPPHLEVPSSNKLEDKTTVPCLPASEAVATLPLLGWLALFQRVVKEQRALWCGPQDTGRGTESVERLTFLYCSSQKSPVSIVFNELLMTK